MTMLDLDLSLLNLGSSSCFLKVRCGQEEGHRSFSVFSVTGDQKPRWMFTELFRFPVEENRPIYMKYNSALLENTPADPPQRQPHFPGNHNSDAVAVLTGGKCDKR